jgi:hypothetical protein
VKTAQYITGTVLLPIQDIYLRKACSMINYPTHPSHELFSPLPSGRQYWSMRADTNGLRDSFYLQIIRLLYT